MIIGFVAVAIQDTQIR